MNKENELEQTEPKWFLLIAGNEYDPEGETANWIGCFASRKEARDRIKDKGDVGFGRYDYNGFSYDWFVVVDLREWIF